MGTYIYINMVASNAARSLQLLRVHLSHTCINIPYCSEDYYFEKCSDKKCSDCGWSDMAWHVYSHH